MANPKQTVHPKLKAQEFCQKFLGCGDVGDEDVYCFFSLPNNHDLVTQKKQLYFSIERLQTTLLIQARQLLPLYNEGTLINTY